MGLDLLGVLLAKINFSWGFTTPPLFLYTSDNERTSQKRSENEL